MYCGKCGKENRDGAAYCAKCGSPLKGNITIHETKEQEECKEEKKKEESLTADNNSGNVSNITISMGETKHAGGSQGNGEGMAIASMVLGIVALVVSCCFYYISLPCAIISVVLAAVTLKGNRGGRGMAIAGLVCSVVSLIPAAIMISTGAAIVSVFN